MLFVTIIDSIIEFLKTSVLAFIILNWLSFFNIINVHNRVVSMIMEILYRIVEPMLRPIRRIVSNSGNVDFSSIFLLLILWIVQRCLPMITNIIF